MINLYETKIKKYKGIYEIIALSTAFFIIGFIFIFKGGQIQKYINEISLSEFQKAGIYFMFIPVFIYLVIKIVCLFRIKLIRAYILAGIMILILISLFLFLQPFIINLKVFQNISEMKQAIIIVAGSISLFSLLVLILIDSLHLLDLYFKESKSIDSKVAVSISAIALIISFLALII